MAKRSLARKKTRTPVRIYNYGVRLTREAEAQAVRILRQAHDYQRDRIIIENARRAAYREARSKLVPEYAEAEEAAMAASERLQAVQRTIKSEKAAARSGRTDDDLAAEAKALRAESAAAWARVKEIRALTDNTDAMRAESERIAALADGDIVGEKSRGDKVEKVRSGGLVKSCYEGSPLYWTTKGMVSNALKAAFRDNPGRLDAWRPFTAEGRIGGQPGTDSSLTTGTVFGSHPYLRLERLPSESWDSCSARRRAYSAGKIRIGSDGRAPLWLEFSALLHRPLPESGTIKLAWLLARKQGGRIRWSLQLTIESEAFERPARRGHKTAVAVGFKALPEGGAQVACAMDVAGSVDYLTIPAELIRRLEHADALQSAGDIAFEAAKAVAKTFRSSAAAPAWFAEATETISHWRNKVKLVRVARRLASEVLGDRERDLWAAWKAHRGWRAPQRCGGRKKRPGGGEDLFGTLDEVRAFMAKGSAAPQSCDKTTKRSRTAKVRDRELAAVAFYLSTWRRKSTHLYQWSRDVDASARRWREDIFRTWRHSLADRALVASCVPLETVTRKPRPEERDGARALRMLRARCSPGRLIEVLKEGGAEELKVTIPERFAGFDSMAARAAAMLEVAGEDIGDIEKRMSEQRAALQTLRDAAE
jgi:hypothetical protein